MFYCDNLKIRDEYGRERIFRGVNICLKPHWMNANFIRHHVLKDSNFEKFNAIGVNIIRLGITWAAIEPHEGKYNDELISALKEYIQKCAENNIYVMFDMHQDVFSHYFHEDGAPKWAIDPSYSNPRPYAIWAEAYFYMQGVQNAFYDFWTNRNNIQTKFVKMWEYVADALFDCDNIIGYDYFNEPYIHKDGRKVFLTLASNVIKTVYGKDVSFDRYFNNCRDKVGFAKMAMKIYSFIRTKKGLNDLLSTMDSEEKFYDAINGLEKYTDEFNSDYYQPFFDNACNNVNKKGIFNFFEHNYYANLGLSFEIKRKENDIYSPHAYDVFIDSPLYNKYSSDNRVRCILREIRKNQLKMNTPVLFGEWGGGAPGHEWLRHIDFIMGEFEKYHWSGIYWSYNFRKDELKEIFNRPYPVAVCGDINEIKTDSKNRKFTLKWTCDKDFDVMTEIYFSNKGIVKYENKIGENEIEIEY
ncbi:MAG: cellulase family glycosylhydrolase [Clostridia bacterium]|nr:cellulase family glycosylhydrolase [Clostridia bacterium]